MERGEQGELFVWLTAQDADKLGVHAMQQGAPPRHALRQILQAAQRQLDFCITQSLTLEMMPAPEGCMLIFTPACAPLPKPPRAIGPTLYFVADSDALLLLAQGLAQVEALVPASLYRANKGFYLLLYARARAPLQRLLQETAVRCAQGDAAAAFVQEHGQACCIGDALQRLRADQRA